MEVTLDIERRKLMGEMVRYLAAVEVFRAEGSEPTWLPEAGTGGDQPFRGSRIHDRSSASLSAS